MQWSPWRLVSCGFASRKEVTACTVRCTFWAKLAPRWEHSEQLTPQCALTSGVHGQAFASQRSLISLIVLYPTACFTKLLGVQGLRDLNPSVQFSQHYCRETERASVLQKENKLKYLSWPMKNDVELAKKGKQMDLMLKLGTAVPVLQDSLGGLFYLCWLLYLGPGRFILLMVVWNTALLLLTVNCILLMNNIRYFF